MTLRSQPDRGQDRPHPGGLTSPMWSPKGPKLCMNLLAAGHHCCAANCCLHLDRVFSWLVFSDARLSAWRAQSAL